MLQARCPFTALKCRTTEIHFPDEASAAASVLDWNLVRCKAAKAGIAGFTVHRVARAFHTITDYPLSAPTGSVVATERVHSTRRATKSDSNS
jgi:hypothetical protein